MSVRLTTSQAVYHAAAPNGGGAFTCVAWIRRESDTGAAETLLARNDDNWVNSDNLDIAATDSLNGWHAVTDVTLGPAIATATWYGLYLGYSAGTLTIRRIADGDLSAATTFDGSSSVGSLSDLSPTQIIMGAVYSDGTTQSADITIANAKWFASALSEADAITELRYRNPQATAWAAYPFASGTLLNDVSGNSRTLTGVGTPTYSADEPTGIEGDDPGGGGGGFQSAWARNSNIILL